MEVFDTHRNLNWFVRLLRLLTLRRVDGLADMASDASVAACAAVALTVWAVIDRLQWGPGVEFDSFGISMLALIAVLVLALAYVTARLSKPPQPVRSTLFIAVAALPLLIIAMGLIDGWVPERWSRLAWVILGLYVLLYTARSLRALSGKVPFRAVLAAAALLGGYLWLGELMDLRPTFWAPPGNTDEPDSSMSAPLAEELLFDQRERVDEALDAVADSSEGEGGPPAVFFVGFAGVASQKVFAEEIKLAAHVVGERFDAATRQLLLINDHRDVDSYPLATVSGLRYALGELAKKMNPERDILFLSLSSHGSDEPLLSVSNARLPLEQVTGENLAAALRDSGIKRRIIVISACYAGAFIAPLKDPDTILITAAAADKTSFGCSDDRDLTYFGEAFYRDALPRARSLQDAFAATRAAIAQRENVEHVTPSDPQAFFGGRIEQLLLRQPMRTPPR
jgi:Peptidase C13 family